MSITAAKKSGFSSSGLMKSWGDKEKAREAVNLGFSRLSDSAALAQYANKYLYSMPEPSMKPKEYEQAIELVFDGQGSHQGNCMCW